MPATIKDYTAKLDSIESKLDNLAAQIAILASHIGGIDKRGQPPKPMRAEYGGKTTRKGQF